MSVFTKNDFQFGYLYGWLDCYNNEFQPNLEDFIIQLNKKCGKTILDLMMLRELMEIISFDTPEIIKNYITVGDSEQDFFVRIINNKVETFEHDYTDCKKFKCHNKAQEKDEDDDYYELCIECEEALINEEREEYNRLEQTKNLIGENPYKIENAIDEFNQFCYKNREEIYTKSKWTGDWDSQNSILLICAEYSCGTKEDQKLSHIHYNYNYWGSERFNQWLDKYNLEYEWNDPCVVHIYNKK